MKLRPWLAVLLASLWSQSALAGNTTTLPAGTFVLDQAYINAVTDVRWDDNRKARGLIEGIQRYEPGGGLQGTITVKPHVLYEFQVSQLFYGVTDNLTLAIGVPVVTRSYIDAHLGWVSGDYQSGLGRSYSEQDFWQWAKSMGQKKPGAFDGNHNTLADIVLGGRYKLPNALWMEKSGLVAAIAAQVALPTGKDPDPEELVATGTTAWDLNNYGDAELHFALERPFHYQGVVRANVGIDMYYGYFRPRTYQTPRGTKNPLLMTYSPYVGDTYTIDPGDLIAGSVLVEVAPLLGPTWATWLAGGKLEKAERFPPLLQVSAGFTYAHVGQSTWRSQSALWNWDREKLFLPGDKDTVKLNADISLLRMGLPLQLYTAYRNQEWVPGRNIRASNSLAFGARLILKFW